MKSPKFARFLLELADLLEKHKAEISCTNDMSGILFSIGDQVELAWGLPGELRDMAKRAD